MRQIEKKMMEKVALRRLMKYDQVANGPHHSSPLGIRYTKDLRMYLNHSLDHMYWSSIREYNLCLNNFICVMIFCIWSDGLGQECRG